jgi:hypothetical protein
MGCERGGKVELFSRFYFPNGPGEHPSIGLRRTKEIDTDCRAATGVHALPAWVHPISRTPSASSRSLTPTEPWRLTLADTQVDQRAHLHFLAEGATLLRAEEAHSTYTPNQLLHLGGALCCRNSRCLAVSREMWNDTQQTLDHRELGAMVHLVLLRTKDHLEASF